MELNTVENVRQFVNVITNQSVTDEELIWFLCMWLADEFLETCKTKDLASLFNEGQQPLNSLDDLQNKLTEEFDGYEENPAFPTLVMKYRLTRHFISYTAAQEYRDQIDAFEE